MRTLQEAFDQSVRGIISQGGPSVDPTKSGGYCLLRGPNNHKCAIGWLIPDDKYDKDLESMSPAGIVKELGEFPVEEPEPEDLNRRMGSFYSQLQKAHDNSACTYTENPGERIVFNDSRTFFHRFRTYLHQLALRYKLNEDVLKEIPIGSRP